MGSRQRVRHRAIDAYDVMRGRRPKPDYGFLIVLPLVAAAGGAIIGLGVDKAVSRRAAARSSTTAPAVDRDPVRMTGTEAARR